VQAVLDKYDGQEVKLMRKLIKKYIDKPAAAAAAAAAAEGGSATGAVSALDISDPQPAQEEPADSAPYVVEETEGEWM
jgi:hypothetical protein